MPPENKELSKAGEAAASARNLFSSMPMKQQENMKFIQALLERLAPAGFGVVNPNEIEKRIPVDCGWEKRWEFPLVAGGEFVFNRGLKGRASNFFVFAKQDSDGVQVFFTDPSPPKGATWEQIYRRYVFVGQDLDGMADRVAKAILECSAKKPLDEYRAVTHHHWGYVNGIRMQDDGVSRFQDSVRMMQLCHTDFDMSTPHNAMETLLPRHIMLKMRIGYDWFRFLRAVEEGLGMVKVAGTEITMSLTPKVPNGPHVCAWPGPREAREMLARRILYKRDPNSDMRSYFLGMGFQESRKVMEEMQAAGILAFAIAHEFNFNAKSLPIYDVGLMTANVHGGLPLKDAEDFMMKAQAIACFNPTLSGDSMPIGGDDWSALRPVVMNAVAYHNWLHPEGPIRRYDVNSVMMAYAEMMRWKHGMGTMFDGDDHVTRPILVKGKYVSGGEIMNMGYTKIVLGPDAAEMVKKADRKPTAEEIVRWLVEKKARMEAVVHTRNDGSGLVVEEGYTHMPEEQKENARILKMLQDHNYAGEVMDDVLKDFFLGGKWDALGHSTG
ncbi:MAG: hypothetical protein PHQ80_02965 [Candidatus ainarchaeum sp.]|nr:hypothetical protein [Candidatus ainarchaeum sp.]